MRFTTIPDSSLPLHATSASKFQSSQPPTTITATFTPITGHLSAAYAAKVSRDLALSSRFTFNINSYESEWTMGGEWWLRRKKLASDLAIDSSPELVAASLSYADDAGLSPDTAFGDIQGVVKARLSTTSVSVYNSCKTMGAHVFCRLLL